MKFVVISDTHNCHRQLKIPKCDVLVHCGDMTGLGSETQLIRVNTWFQELKESGLVKEIIVTPGNHDSLFERHTGLAKGYLDAATVLIDQEMNLEGLRIYGSPWQPEFNNWAFNLKRGEELQRKWDLIPDGLDLLITHCPPQGILDSTPHKQLLGCFNLLETVRQRKPRVHVFGHIHYGYGQMEFDGIRFINASSLNENYQVTNKPIEIGIEA